MEKQKMSPLVRNQMAGIGNILLEISLIATDDEQLNDIENEFQRIAVEITSVFVNRPNGTKYFLQYHIAEATRLRNSIIIDNLGDEDDEENANRYKLKMYKLIKENLDELLYYMKHLENGDGINLDLDNETLKH